MHWLQFQRSGINRLPTAPLVRMSSTDLLCCKVHTVAYTAANVATLRVQQKVTLLLFVNCTPSTLLQICPRYGCRDNRSCYVKLYSHILLLMLRLKRKQKLLVFVKLSDQGAC